MLILNVLPLLIVTSKYPFFFFFFYELKFLNLYIFKIDPAFCMGKMQTGLHLIIIYLYEIAFLKQ